ncbi:HGGxSTG domain-containing protein [Bradyrhizobium sp. TZ2]
MRSQDRSGAPCKSAPVTGRRRCRMHGGADGSGAPKGERNGNYKHGRYTKEVAATRRWLRGHPYALRAEKAHLMTIETTESSTQGKEFQHGTKRLADRSGRDPAIN